MKFLSWLRCYVVRIEERLRNMHILERAGDVDREIAACYCSFNFEGLLGVAPSPCGHPGEPRIPENLVGKSS